MKLFGRRRRVITPALLNTAANGRAVQAATAAPKGKSAARKSSKPAARKPVQASPRSGSWYAPACRAYGKPFADRAKASGVKDAEGFLEFANKHGSKTQRKSATSRKVAPRTSTTNARTSARQALKNAGESAMLQSFSRRWGADFACRAFKAGCRTMGEADALYCKDNRAGLEAESPIGARDPIARAAFAMKQRRAAAADRKAASRRPAPTTAERQRREIALLKQGVRPSVAKAAASMRI